ncbi:phage major capsid protein [Lactococcus lactis]|uniref:Phage major capsid protein n=1 Tax=Lactococcus lactis subsp. lactis TaxID=1360 RepID=A0A2N5W9S7_LACLL|nr:phage major capsid protein [Lactococcus lactis]PLW58999.1 hypothetical protein CYU10_002401 [Lactococcus lactis subsp. lactis]
MNKLDKIELEKSIKDLQARKNELSELILAENSVENAEKLHAEAKENAQALKLAEIKLQENSQIKGEPTMTKYLETKNSSRDFINILKSAGDKEAVVNAWGAKLAENDLKVEDKGLLLPKRLVDSIETALVEANPVFKVFQLTHVGALLVQKGLKSTDEAKVHVEGTEKVLQNAVLTTDAITPQLIYKAQSISTRTKEVTENFEEIYAVVVAELTQAIVNKAVDLALIEGTGNEDGFLAIMKETDAEKVKEIKSATLVDGIEDATDFVRGREGRKFLIVTAEQRKALLGEVRALVAPARVRNDDAELASEVGVDELIVYTGSKAIKPIVIVDQSYKIDMKDLTKVDAFEWKTNGNVILMESLSAGKMNKIKGASFITVTPQ